MSYTHSHHWWLNPELLSNRLLEKAWIFFPLMIPLLYQQQVCRSVQKLKYIFLPQAMMIITTVSVNRCWLFPASVLLQLQI